LAVLLGSTAAVLAVRRLAHDRMQALALLGAAVVFMILATVVGGAARRVPSGRREP
jgi:hypothetical protein